MSHVLLSGSIDRFPELRSRLLGWGYTVGSIADCVSAVPDGGVPDLGACDLVIHVGTAGWKPGAMPDGAQEAGGAAPAAPLLILGGDGPESSAFEALADPGPSFVLLRAAIARAEAHVRILREGPGSDDRRGFLQFLGHELRSPLAALKTALDVLNREDAVEPAAVRMLDLAARNTDRLAAAVEWSQDLREIEEAPPVPRLREIPVGDLVRNLGNGDRHIRVAADPACPVVTDVDLAASVVAQMERVMTTVYPGGEIDMVIEDAGDGLILVLTSEGDARPVGGLQMGEISDDVPEIERLARMMCSPCLLQILGLSPRAHAEPDGRSGLAVELPLAAPVPAS